ncbi:perosamine synthetase [Paucidesulfovibrio gracilis DSM 16080]|uniref:Perosamine synthetase n=1 Tax=Paucidesulfovibrio gracilis DSM 16080 TaxID=1121449 RepID=A0A1T4XRF9_9BACT|nr:UDP-4-amino-4,6-dideoxy-N-acetyl-beta-L-altrosamine transaminase [Paucidesulfovibrio gracilis]SKA92137.1 perosamine synthetase [Paucidesulfovibrio gracilis DSM 16080]
MIPYGHQSVDEEDIRAVTEVLRSDWLTCGARVGEFESSVADFCGAKHAVAVSSGTAALHAAMAALGIGPGDEVIVPAMTFAATANAVLYCGAQPVFADVDPDRLLIDPDQAAELVTPATKAIVGVDYAGHPCDWIALRRLADRHGLQLIADSCHAIGARTVDGVAAGTFGDMNIFSFHPVKHVATGEGGMVLTQDATLAENARRFRNHGITTTARQREKAHAWQYDMVELGYNYRITDIQCALGITQMHKLPASLDRRREIAERYNARFQGTPVRPLGAESGVEHAYHLYVVRVAERDRVFADLRQQGIGVQVHYRPVHLHPYYRERLGTAPGQCPVAEAAVNEILSLPMFPGLGEEDFAFVVRTLLETCPA